ncbi:MAG: site-2 protease family protein [Myxococcota bacterium]|nr:site-2 protease family protein [Myxococcota bacterium]
MMGNVDIHRVMVNFFAITLALTVHEYAHAWVADKLGDPTPRRAGRLVFSTIPIMRAEPFGALIVPLLGAFSGFLIGWASTPVNPRLINRKYTLRQGERWIAAAGPISNFLFFLVSLLHFTLLSPHRGSTWGAPLFALSQALIFVNCLLTIFNLIPIPPLDGFTVLESSASRELSGVVSFLRQYGTILLLLVFFKGSVLFRPIFSLVARLMYSLEGLLL